MVAPYNARVRLLKSKLPTGARVATVDKFQGQEAPVVFFSMTSSSGEDVPRGVDFLFNRTGGRRVLAAAAVEQVRDGGADAAGEHAVPVW